ncbi:protein phosphatase 2C domain-containing protein [Paenibacillus alginolyticus]|uniref:Protein phosphatase 2C domain-containing protein n=1 Tax=Paenibacillus alginolyticus TaxID=59839 RepID=A0ABT4G7A4_9BACL|nr:protein phosphatase 2C domain-containing protein [Paenibacillus alginolyticus]MCY9692047.1 protein phosphatase 2C domain-containing protein [Paenibacillus alginolyticus]
MERIDPRIETPLQQIMGSFHIRYSYYRAAETRLAGDSGQDYFVWKQQKNSFIFALCDGVSMSFFGEIAAQLLGDFLIDCLSIEELNGYEDHLLLQKKLQQLLHDYTFHASEQVSKYQLPKGIPNVLNEVLEEKRVLGSETTFVCGRIDLPDSSHPNGKIMLAWLGDSRLQIWDSEKELNVLGETFISSERWSTKRGCIGHEPHVLIRPLITPSNQINRIVAYSDGLTILDDLPHILDNELLQVQIIKAAMNPTSDDISLFEVGWNNRKQAQVVESRIIASEVLEFSSRTRKRRPSKSVIKRLLTFFKWSK